MTDIQSLISDASARYDVPPAVLMAVGMQESGMKPIGVHPTQPAVGNEHAVGMFGLLPSTAKELGVDPANPGSAVYGAAAYLRQGFDRTGNWDDAVRYFHGGPDTRQWKQRTEAYHASVSSRIASGAPAPAASAPAPASNADPFLDGLTGHSSAPSGDNADPFLAGLTGKAGSAKAAPNAEPDRVPDRSGAERPVRPADGATVPVLAGGQASPGGGEQAPGGGWIDAVHDFGAGLTRSFDTVANTAARLGASALEDSGFAPGAKGWAERNLVRSPADSVQDRNPDGWSGFNGQLAGDLLLTAPLTELKLFKAAPDAGRLAAGLAKYGNYAAQGGAAGVMLSGGKDVKQAALLGAATAPIVGKAIEVVAPPVIALAGRAKNLALGIKNRVEIANDVRQAVANAINTGDYAKARNLAAKHNLQEVDAWIKYRQNGGKEPIAFGASPGEAERVTAPQVDNPVPAGAEAAPTEAPAAPAAEPDIVVSASPKDIAAAMGSQAARRGVESTQALPPKVQARFAELRAQGVPEAEALAQADIEYVGGKPTVANVTRDRGEQQAMFEGAKQPTTEGRELAQRIADNNAALHTTLRDTVQGYGGVPSQGEVAEVAAEALAKGSAAERARVKSLYDAAAVEHGQIPPEASEPNINIGEVAPPAQERPLQLDPVDENDALTPYSVTTGVGGQVRRRGPMDLVSWLRANGGLKDSGGELRHMGIDNKPRDLDFARNEGFLGSLVGGPHAMDFDTAANYAHEAGFFPLHGERPSVDEFLEALRDTHFGTDRAFRLDDHAELEAFERLRQERFERERLMDEAAAAVERPGTEAGEEHTLQHVPASEYEADLHRNGGAVGAKPLYTLLNSVEMKAPTTPEGRSFASGIKRALDIISERGKKAINPHDLERLRQMASAAYGRGEVNILTGKFKAEVDKLFDRLGDASPAYKAARAAHRKWAAAYDDPEGIAKLIKRDKAGNLLNADNWRRAENGLIGATTDRQFAQVVRQLKSMGETQTLDRLKAAIVQQAYERATQGARDELGNATLNGGRFVDELNKIGTNKIRAIFSQDEIAHLATVGRAARALNEAVPGTVNTSNTASALIRALAPQGKTSRNAKMAARAGAHVIAGLTHPVVGNIAVEVGSHAAEGVGKRRAAQTLASALRQHMDPDAARLSAKAQADRAVAATRRRLLARSLAERSAGASETSRRRIAR